MATVQRELLVWYARFGRDLPWRRTRDPYAVLVSEVMLQQTQVDRVVPKWQSWLAEFPTIEALARAPRAHVIRAWQGLGYNLRAVRLHQMAVAVCDLRGGRLPATPAELRALRGLGAYAAAAVACFAFDVPVAVVDTNVRRVLGRVFLGQPWMGRADARRTQELAASVLPAVNAYAWNQALMDLGATICTQARPACLMCPLVGVCLAAPFMGTWRGERHRALKEPREPFRASRRFYRGRLVEALRNAGDAVGLSELGQKLKADFADDDLPWLAELVATMAAEGLVEVVLDGPTSAVRLPQ